MTKGLTVNVNIEGVTLPMTVKTTEDERIYRTAASLVNSRLRAMRDRYPSLPNDAYYYAMVLLNTTVDALRSGEKSDNTPLMDMMKDLSNEIDAVTKK
ncbi:MAG: cell division protein ZapA [Prevotellaceae bacterium]|nr:cell division protein ZapA [Candidatus Colivivens equi]MCQ2075508.1 cell division protein ZapA [Bacteroidaceae bacterium]